MAIIGLDTPQVSPVATFGDMKLIDYWWKPNGIILILVWNEQTWQRFLVFDLQTRKLSEVDALSFRDGFVVNPLARDPESVLLSTFTVTGVDLRKLNLRTMKSTTLQTSVDGLDQWLTDREGKPLAGYGFSKHHWFMIFPGQPADEWRRVDLGDKNRPDFLPVAVYSDQRRIIGIDYASDNTASVAVWDPANDSKETIWHSAEVDPISCVAWDDDSSNIRAVAYGLAHPSYYYLDPKDQELAAQVDVALPGTMNRIVSMSADESKFLIRASSDLVPESYFVLNLTTNALQPLGSTHRLLDSIKLAPARHFDFIARDGIKIHGYLYLPRESNGAPPAIVFTGANLHEHSPFPAYQPYLQLLANRGYATIEIDHRGVRGYGEKFSVAGDMQIAGTMGDDLVDGVKWLVHEGLIDRNRIALAGQNAGGYLAMHTLVRYPGVFSAWINFDTPMDNYSLEFADVLFGRYNDKDVIARMGGEEQGRVYLRSLDLLPILRMVTVPSFHFYPRNPRDNTTLHGGDSVRKYLAKSGPPYVFVQSAAVTNFDNPTKNRDQKVLADTARIYGELLGFLDKYLRAVGKR